MRRPRDREPILLPLLLLGLGLASSLAPSALITWTLGLGSLILAAASLLSPCARGRRR
jgi:hypothetical protein